MKKKADEAQNMLNALRDTESELAAMGTQKPAGWDQMPHNDKINYLEQVKNELSGTDQVTETLQKANEHEMEMINQLQNQGVKPPTSAVVSHRKMFNLKKFSQQMNLSTMQPEGNAEEVYPSDPMADSDSGTTNVSQVRQLLDGFVDEAIQSGVDDIQANSDAIDKAYQYITSRFTNPNEQATDPFSNVEGNSQQTVRDAVNSYYSSPDDDESGKDRIAALLANTIFPHNGAGEDGTEVPAIKQEGVKVNVANLVKNTNEIIRKMAKKDATAKVSRFNLAKISHVKNMTVFDPEKSINDAVTNQPMSENDLLERNKGYGIKLTDQYSLNWEKVWRETVMDKYDPLYLERRFEVDKNVPPTNNYQLQPGEKRRITPPEYGNTESRLEAARDEMNKDRGYSPSSKGEPFNWKKAQQEKKAQGMPPLGNVPSAGEMMGTTAPNVRAVSNWKCKMCGNTAKNGARPLKCEKCAAENAHFEVPAKTAPDAAKAKSSPVFQGGIPIMGSNQADVEKLSSIHGGVFWDSSEKKFFVVSKNKKKKKFDTYYEAEEFKMLVSDPSAVGQQPDIAPPSQPSFSSPLNNKKKAKNLDPKQIARQREIANHADVLGIDG